MGRFDTYIYQRHDSARAILLQPVGSFETANETQGGRNRSISYHEALRGLRFNFPLNGLKPPDPSRSASAAHARFHHRFHVVWVTNIARRFCRVRCVNGFVRLSENLRRNGGLYRARCKGQDHVHMFFSIPSKLALSNVMQRIKGRSSRLIQMEFPELRKRYWGRRFWDRGYVSTTSGNITDDIITQYLELYSSK